MRGSVEEPLTCRTILLQVRNPGDPARDDEHRAFATRLNVSPSAIRTVDVLTETLGPQTHADVDVVLVGGSGEYSVLDDAPPIHRFIDYLALVSNSGTPFFASCFGFQALVLGLGGEVVKDEDNAEVGTYDLELTEAGVADPLFGTLPRAFKAQLGHKDQVRRLPECLVNLASSPRTRIQAYRMTGRPVYATQFHPELTWLENRARFERYYEEYGRVFGEEAAKAQLDGHQPSPEVNTLLPAFVEQFVHGAGEGT
jgi:GMP synthase (glutamine-hydrolysing)